MRGWVGIAAAGFCRAACSGVQSPLDPAGDQAQSLFSLFSLMLAVCGVAYLLVLAFLAWAIWRARGRLGDYPADEAARGDGPGLQRAFGVWIGLIVVGLTLLALGSFVAERSLAQARAREALQVHVTGHQWWWRITYRDPASGAWIETANELHLPQGRTARIELSAADVIHSFWVPNVAGKMDVIPGHANVIDLTPRRLGWFRGQCAEFCGLQHAHMALDVKVEPPDAFDAWLAAESRTGAAPPDAVAQRGQRVFASGACATCHTIRGTSASGRPGPDLTHLASRQHIAAGLAPMSRAALQGWIAQPQALKPGTNMPTVRLAAGDADAVARYLEALK
jgi:cytochrome c oxidase subunit 2